MLSVVGGALAFAGVYAVSGYSFPPDLARATGESANAFVGRLVVGLTHDALPLSWVAVAQTGLWLGLLGVPLWACSKRGNGIVSDLRLRLRPSDVPAGLAIGVFCQLIVLPLVYVPIFVLTDLDGDDLSEAARSLTDRAVDPLSVAMLVLVVGIGAPVIEEIFYRGMVMGALGRSLGPLVSIGGSSLWFAAAHFQALQFPGLLVFGLVLAFVAHRTGRLGMAIFAHVGFNMTTVVLLVA